MTTTALPQGGGKELPIKVEPTVEIHGQSREVKDIRHVAMRVADSSPYAEERVMAHTVLELLPYVERAQACEAQIAAKPRRKPRKKAE